MQNLNLLGHDQGDCDIFLESQNTYNKDALFSTDWNICVLNEKRDEL